jgi:hypothetical protein
MATYDGTKAKVDLQTQPSQNSLKIELAEYSSKSAAGGCLHMELPYLVDMSFSSKLRWACSVALVSWGCSHCGLTETARCSC